MSERGLSLPNLSPLPLATRLIALAREPGWLRRDRVVLWSVALIVEQVAMLGYIVLRAHGAFGPAQLPFAMDFTSFYAAGRLALAGTPALAYDMAAHWQAQQAVGGADAPYNYFFYPPPFLALCAGLATLPYLVAFALFEATTLTMYLLVARRIAAVGGWSWCAPALAFPAVYWCLGLGQNAFLSAALFGLGTMLIDTRPLAAGGVLGMLCWKPHFGLLMPVALAAGGHWRGFIGATLSVAALAGASLLLFGAGTWQAYLGALSGSDEVYSSGKIMLSGYVTVFGAARLLGAQPGAAMALQALAGLAAAGIVGWVWRRRAALPLRAASLIAGTLLSVPLALIYDLLLLAVCLAWLVRLAKQEGYLPWEKSLYLTVYAIGLAALPVGQTLGLPLGVIAPLLIMGICVRRYRNSQRHIRTS